MVLRCPSKPVRDRGEQNHRANEMIRVTQTLYTTVTPTEADADQTQTVEQGQQQNLVTTTSNGIVYVVVQTANAQAVEGGAVGRGLLAGRKSDTAAGSMGLVCAVVGVVGAAVVFGGGMILL